MQIHQDSDIYSYTIRSHEDNVIVVNMPIQQSLTDQAGHPTTDVPKIKHERLQHSFIIAQDTLIPNWAPHCLEQLSAEHVAMLADLRPEVVVIGTGNRLRHPDRTVLRPLIEGNIGYEIMDNAAACRTYNVLTYEGRRTAAGFIIERSA